MSAACGGIRSIRIPTRKPIMLPFSVLTDHLSRYTHYFEGDDGSTVESLMGLIAHNNDPTNAVYNFIVTCKNDPICDGGSLAVTDAPPPTDTFTPRMRLCPKFFDPATPQTKNNLSSKNFVKNPGRRENSWCQPGQKFPFFEVAGTTILHEMTHLDGVGCKLHLRPNVPESRPSHVEPLPCLSPFSTSQSTHRLANQRP